MTKYHWSFVMALAWAGWRRLDRVCQYWDDYRRHAKCWKLPKLDINTHPIKVLTEEHLVPHRSMASIFELERSSAFASGLGEEPIIQVPVARELLWDAIVSGRITATGVDPYTGERGIIPACLFSKLVIHPGSDGADLLSEAVPISSTQGFSGACADGEGAIYLLPQVLRADVMELWQPTWIGDRVAPRQKRNAFLAEASRTMPKNAASKKITPLQANTLRVLKSLPQVGNETIKSHRNRVCAQLEKEGLKQPCETSFRKIRKLTSSS